MSLDGFVPWMLVVQLSSFSCTQSVLQYYWFCTVSSASRVVILHVHLFSCSLSFLLSEPTSTHLFHSTAYFPDSFQNLSIQQTALTDHFSIHLCYVPFLLQMSYPYLFPIKSCPPSLLPSKVAAPHTSTHPLHSTTYFLIPFKTYQLSKPPVNHLLLLQGNFANCTLRKNIPLQPPCEPNNWIEIAAIEISSWLFFLPPFIFNLLSVLSTVQ